MSGSSIKRFVISTLICAPFFAAGCTTAKEPLVPKLAPGPSSFSNYLIGEYAVRHREMQDATEFLSQIQDAADVPPSLAENIDRQLFTILAGEGRIDEAAKVAEKTGAEDMMNQLVLVIRDVAHDDFKAALTGVDKMTSSGLGAYVKPLIQAWVVAANKDIASAQKALQPLGKQKGLEALYHLHSALLYEYDGQLKKAEEQYLQAGEGPNGISLRLAELYGGLLVKQDRQEEARKVFEKYFTAHPESLYIQAMLDELKSGKLGKMPPLTIKDGIAETLFGLSSSLRSQSTRQAGLIMGRLALHVKPDFPIAQILVAEILETDQRFVDANTVYATVPKNNPFSWSARLRMALNLDDMGKTDDAVDILEKMTKQHPDRLEAYTTLGDVLRHRERFEGAQAAYEKALKLIGDNVERYHWNLFYSRAITLERLKRWDEAEPLFLKALELEPNQPFVLNYLGYSWIEMGKNIDRAQKMIEEAVAQRPRDGYIVDSLGWVLYKAGDYETAVRHLERAVELQPSDPVINDHLGDVYWKVGRNREARFQWKRAKSLDPSQDLMDQLDRKLENGLEEN
ncbi:MAG: tetratricopeptide repeat protein [Methylocystaceae bacterium]|nr:tetratricopeptide repeat protein [Methylocystaceae bacterium]